MTPEPIWDPTEFQETLGRFLDRQDWSQNRLATELGVSQTAVNRWFQPVDKKGPGRPSRPRPDVLGRLATLIRHPLNDLQRMCNYPVGAESTHADPALNAVQTLMRAAYEATEDAERRRIGLDAIEALVQSVWAAHPRRRRSHPRDQGPANLTPPESTMLRVSYA